MTVKNANRSRDTASYPVTGYGRSAKIKWKAQLHCIGAQPAYFSVTGEVRNPWRRDILAGGQLHGELADVRLVGHDAMLPEIVRWHLTSVADGPMHYLANSLYWFEQGNLEYFRNACVFGAVEGDVMPTTLAEATVFLRARKPALMAAFERDMVAWFGADVVAPLGLPGTVDATAAETTVVNASV